MTMAARALRGPAPGWNAFVASAVDGTVFHRLDFLDYHPPGRYAFQHLLVESPEGWAACVPGALRAEEGGTAFISPAGASFGGPVFAAGTGGEAIRGVAASLAGLAARERWRRLVLTPPPALYWSAPEAFGDLAEALAAAGFREIARETSQQVPLGGDEASLWDRLDRMARKAVRRAEREGVTVARERDWGAFHALLERNRARHGAAPTHSAEELARLDRLVGESLVLFVARKGEALAGGTLAVRANERVALNFYLAHDENFQAERPGDLLVWESLKWARREGFRHYDFGTSTLGGVMNPGLWAFKAKFGALDHARVTWEWRP